MIHFSLHGRNLGLTLLNIGIKDLWAVIIVNLGASVR